MAPCKKPPGLTTKLVSRLLRREFPKELRSLPVSLAVARKAFSLVADCLVRGQDVYLPELGLLKFTVRRGQVTLDLVSKTRKRQRPVPKIKFIPVVPLRKRLKALPIETLLENDE